MSSEIMNSVDSMRYHKVDEDNLDLDSLNPT